jgi:hypothetical protein
MEGLPASLYAADGDAFVPTELTRGPWSAEHQHAGPPAALLARAVERAAGIDPGQVASLRYDILRPVPLAPLAVAVRVLRPGRRVEQLEATLAAAARPDEPLMRLTAWRMRAAPVPLREDEAPGPAPGEPGRSEPAPLEWWPRAEVGYHLALDWHIVEGGWDRPGPATAWTRLRVPLLAGEEPSPLERLLVMADAASGISAVRPFTDWLFINVDLGVALERRPEGEWMAMAARTQLGPDGAGLCTSVLSDRRGRLGVTTQSLLVGPHGGD